MPTKLKNADEICKPNKIKAFLLSKKLRTVVFSVTCILTAIIYILTLKFSDFKQKYPYQGDGLYLQDYTESYEFSSKKLSFYEALCITSSFYLRNTDNNNKFLLSDSTFSDFIKTMDSYDLQIKTDKQGRVSADSSFWDFFVAFGDKYITNIKDLNITKQTEITELPYQLTEKYDDYSLRVNDTMNSISSTNSYYSEQLFYSDFFVNNGFSDEYTDGEILPLGASGYDNLGRFIFQYYGDSDVRFYDKNKKDKKFDDISIYELYYNYNVNGDSDFWESGIDGYEFTIYDDSPITLFFAPKSEHINKYAAALAEIKDDYKPIVL